MQKIDIHCHILPGIDDGAKNLEMALQMAQIAVDSGTSEMVVTPHHNNGVYRNERDYILECLKGFKEQLLIHNIPLTLYPGSELHLMPELVQELSYDTVLTYADKGKAVLVELPKQSIPVGVNRVMDELLHMGITPVIAHPERNVEILQNPGIYEKWVEQGCRGQVTAMSINGDFGQKIKSICHRWLNNGYVHFLASDAHRPKGRSPDMSDYYDYVCDEFDETLASLLFYENPYKLIRGQYIESFHSKSKNPFEKVKKIFGIH